MGWYRTYHKKRSWRFNRGKRATRTRVVKLSTEVLAWTMTPDNPPNPFAPQSVPFLFTPAMCNGFLEYAPVYSEFRIMKASLDITDLGVYTVTDPDTENEAVKFIPVNGQVFTYTSSQPFTNNAAIVMPTPQITSMPVRDFCARIQTDLLQSRWSRLRKTRTTTSGVRVSFYPYQLSWKAHGLAGPQGQTQGYVEQLSGRRWMPMSFFGQNPQDNPVDDVLFIGPYLPSVQTTILTRGSGGQPPKEQTGNIPISAIRARLTVYLQFRGQK